MFSDNCSGVPVTTVRIGRLWTRKVSGCRRGVQAFSDKEKDAQNVFPDDAGREDGYPDSGLRYFGAVIEHGADEITRKRTQPSARRISPPQIGAAERGNRLVRPHDSVPSKLLPVDWHKASHVSAICLHPRARGGIAPRALGSGCNGQALGLLRGHGCCQCPVDNSAIPDVDRCCQHRMLLNGEFHPVRGKHH